MVYLFLAWYLYEITPSKHGVSKPIHFIFSYFFPQSLSQIITPSSFHIYEPVVRHNFDTNSSISDTSNTSSTQIPPPHNNNSSYIYNPIQTSDTATGVNSNVPVLTTASAISNDPTISNSSNSNSSNITISQQEPYETHTTTTNNNNNNNNNSNTVYSSEPLNQNLLSTEAAVKINDLRKTFDKKLVVNRMTLQLYENQIFALLGRYNIRFYIIIIVVFGSIE